MVQHSEFTFMTQECKLDKTPSTRLICLKFVLSLMHGFSRVALAFSADWLESPGLKGLDILVEKWKVLTPAWFTIDQVELVHYANI